MTLNSTATQRIFSALILAGILSIGSSLTSLNAAVAYPKILAQSTSQTINSVSEPIAQRGNRLPSRVSAAVRQDLSRRTGIALERLRITRSSRQTWSDGCLGLGGPDESCIQALIEGWRVVVSNGRRNWAYRTDNTGRNIRLENRDVSANLPKSVEQLVSQRTGVSTIRPDRIPASELPPTLTRGMVFRAISSGGIAGRTYETVLMDDGRLMRVRIGDANDSERSVLRVSPQQVRQFQRLLERQQLSRFNRLSYPAPSGAADFITVTLTSSSGTTRYADIVADRLPRPLQEIVRAWNQITSSARS